MAGMEEPARQLNASNPRKLREASFFCTVVHYILSQAYSAAIFAELYECCEFYLLYLGTYYTSFLYALVAKVKKIFVPSLYCNWTKVCQVQKKNFSGWV